MHRIDEAAKSSLLLVPKSGGRTASVRCNRVRTNPGIRRDEYRYLSLRILNASHYLWDPVSPQLQIKPKRANRRSEH